MRAEHKILPAQQSVVALANNSRVNVCGRCAISKRSVENRHKTTTVGREGGWIRWIRQSVCESKKAEVLEPPPAKKECAQNCILPYAPVFVCVCVRDVLAGLVSSSSSSKTQWHRENCVRSVGVLGPGVPVLVARHRSCWHSFARLWRALAGAMAFLLRLVCFERG